MAANEQNWSDLESQATRLEPSSLRQLFADDPDRFAKFSYQLEDLLLDFSKERIDAKCLDALVKLAKSAGLEKYRDAMFAGDKINFTENRSVLHTALRASPTDGFVEDGNLIGTEIAEVLDRVCNFADAVRQGSITASNGSKFTDVINIGIGGSDLGPVMVTRALSPYRGDGPKTHFVSNVDGAHLADTIANLNPKTTLVIVASKTFTTLETMTNATAARNWLEAALGKDAANNHLAALSTNLDATAAFGIDPDRVFGFWDWVGGRYSVWSAIGLSVALAIGSKNFRAFLAGARAMDIHFRSADLSTNLPVLLALVGIWRRNIMKCPTVALIPYDQRLERLAAYVQQLDMESNGKQTDRNGNMVATATGPVIWGEPGTNAQHSFFQLVHQGTDPIPVDFILAAKPGSKFTDQHQLLQANCLAQSEALAFGKTRDEVVADMRDEGREDAEIEKLAAHRTFPGNRPSTTIIHEKLDPFTLGRLIALYEHKVFVQGVIWGVNSFDQWGVELGKKLTSELIPVVRNEKPDTGKDSSTRGLLAKLRQLG